MDGLFLKLWYLIGSLVPPALEEEQEEVEVQSGDVAIAATEVIAEAIAPETEE